MSNQFAFRLRANENFDGPTKICCLSAQLANNILNEIFPTSLGIKMLADKMLACLTQNYD